MGAIFQIEHANFVAYLTTDGRAKAPHADQDNLKTFLLSLAEPLSLISSTQGTPEDWTRRITEDAEEQAKKLGGEKKILTPAEVSRRLNPLRAYFTGYELYAMVLPSAPWGQDSASR